jgi:nitrite reductase (NADH) small subunit
MKTASHWIPVGDKNNLVPGAGIGAKLGIHQVALFWIPELDNRIFALSNYCPFSGVHIIARGIVGDIGGEPVIASPLYKQHFSLLDGRCLERPEMALDTWEVRLEGDQIQLLAKAFDELAA